MLNRENTVIYIDEEVSSGAKKLKINDFLAKYDKSTWKDSVSYKAFVTIELE